MAPLDDLHDTAVRPHPGAQAALVAAMLAGADSRTQIDPGSGTNKYLCPPLPAPGLTCLSSCTATPVSPDGILRAQGLLDELTDAATATSRRILLRHQRGQIAAAIAAMFGVAGRADIILCPSGTDAIQTAACLLVREHPAVPVTVILPAGAETGTGVALAASCRTFDGVQSGTPVLDAAMTTIEIALRDEEGQPRDEDDVSRDFARAVAGVSGRPLLVLTHGSKTGLTAPATPPDMADVIVDACQARLEARQVEAYLARGWPVVITGSKFFGGPAFSGAVLFPTARLLRGAEIACPDPGTLLRWTAALPTLERFSARADAMGDFLARSMEAIRRILVDQPRLMPVAGARPAAMPAGWSDQPSIATFAVYDRADRRRLLTMAELAPVHRALARAGVLLGQPVGLGRFGGLRIALGARNFLDGDGEDAMGRLSDALRGVLAVK